MIDCTVIRPTQPGDADGLARLYEGLSMADRHLRFFAQYHPDRSILEDWTCTDDSHFNLVAVALPGQRIIGHATAAVLPDGDADFGLVVDAAWRGGLGGELFDALRRAGAEWGVANLCGDILDNNRPMRRLVRRRGYVTLDRPEPGLSRIAVGASQPTPVWPYDGDTRPRILVEAPGGRWRGEATLRAARFKVATCPGPGAGAPCPVQSGRPCPLVTECQTVVVVSRGEHDPADPGTSLARSHACVHPSIPVRVVAPAAEGLADLRLTA